MDFSADRTETGGQGGGGGAGFETADRGGQGCDSVICITYGVSSNQSAAGNRLSLAVNEGQSNHRRHLSELLTKSISLFIILSGHTRTHTHTDSCISTDMNGDGQEGERRICPPLSAAASLTSAAALLALTLSQMLLSAALLLCVFK